MCITSYFTRNEKFWRKAWQNSTGTWTALFAHWCETRSDRYTWSYKYALSSKYKYFPRIVPYLLLLHMVLLLLLLLLPVVPVVAVALVLWRRLSDVLEFINIRNLQGMQSFFLTLVTADADIHWCLYVRYLMRIFTLYRNHANLKYAYFARVLQHFGKSWNSP